MIVGDDAYDLIAKEIAEAIKNEIDEYVLFEIHVTNGWTLVIRDLGGISSQECADIQTWTTENAKQPWKHISFEKWAFCSKEDASWFIMKWGGQVHESMREFGTWR